ncbi:MAG TPA: hypothetical protein VFW24_09285 [Acidimicrobiales bacterium]|nr:hypothetical protein [Acidimicrobiales bacterium]
MDTSTVGHASTWIGVQSTREEFIQIGTVEDEVLAGTRPIYAAFWSDVSVGFHPQPLGIVEPGDVIRVDMSQVPSGWVLHIIDEHVRLDRRLQSHYGPGVNFDAGEWIQEDPAVATSPPTDLPYPKTSDVVFTDLRENGRPPHLTFSDGQSLASPNGVYLVPTPPAGNSFRFRPATPSQAAYLADAGPANFAVLRFEAALDGIGSLSASEAAREAIAAVITFKQSIESQHWPSAVSARLGALLDSQDRLAKQLESWLANPSRSRAQAVQILRRVLGPDHKAALAVRGLLGLPPR